VLKLKPKVPSNEILCKFMMTMPKKHFAKLNKLGRPHDINVQEVVRQMVARELEKR